MSGAGETCRCWRLWVAIGLLVLLAAACGVLSDDRSDDGIPAEETRVAAVAPL